MFKLKLTKNEDFYKRESSIIGRPPYTTDAADVIFFLRREVSELGYYLRHLSDKQKKV